jgi:hypothetical protein
MRLPIAVAALALVMAAGCGSGGGDRAFIARQGEPASTAPKSPTTKTTTESTVPGPVRPACALLSPADVGATVGNPVAAGVGQGPNCYWATTVDGGTSATITAVKPGPAQGAESCDYLRLGQPVDAKHEPVAGLGTSAVWVFQPLTTLSQGSVVACWPDAAVLVLLTGEHDANAMRATAVDLVRKVHAQT